MSERRIGELQRLHAEREKRAAAELARANLVLHDAQAEESRARETLTRFGRARQERERTIYNSLIGRPVRTLDLELLHAELEVLSRREQALTRLFVDAEAQTTAATHAMEEAKAAYFARYRALRKWDEVLGIMRRDRLRLEERKLEAELDERASDRARGGDSR